MSTCKKTDIDQRIADVEKQLAQLLAEKEFEKSRVFKGGDRVVCVGTVVTEIKNADNPNKITVHFDRVSDIGVMYDTHYKMPIAALQKASDFINSEASVHRDDYQKVVKQKDDAYAERNKLVAALSKIFPASIERHEGDWEDDWRNIIFIDLPDGQASWHIHDSELPLFDHLPKQRGRKWDGHTSDVKYDRLAALASISHDATGYGPIKNSIIWLVKSLKQDEYNAPMIRYPYSDSEGSYYVQVAYVGSPSKGNANANTWTRCMEPCEDDGPHNLFGKHTEQFNAIVDLLTKYRQAAKKA